MLGDITGDELLFFDQYPQSAALYAAFRAAVAQSCPDASLRVQKTQITFVSPKVFACVSLPVRRWKGFPETKLVVTLGLGRRLDSPRAAVAVEPYPGRWTHHFPISGPEELDGELMAWTGEAYSFSRAKR